MRVLFHILLTLLIAVPVVLGFALFLVLEGARGTTPVREREEGVSTQGGGGLGERHTA